MCERFNSILRNDYFLAAGFLAGAFLAAVLAGGLAVVFLAAGFAATFLVPVALATPEAFALAASWLFLRAAFFLLITPFLTALSRLLWAADCALALGLLMKALRAVLRLRLVFELRTVALRATLTRFFADLIIGIYIPLRFIAVSTGYYKG
jgi:hypothetical protein